MILLYNTNATLNPNAYLTLAIEDALRRLVGTEVRRVDETTLAPAAAAGPHALLVCIDGQRLDRGLIARVRPGFRKLVLWVFEDPFMLDHNLASLDLFDLVFTNDPSCVAAYGPQGRYLPLAGSRMLQYRDVLPDQRLRYDIFFAGTMWPNRVAALRRIIAAFPHASMKLICPTNEYLPPLPPLIAERAITRPVSHPAFIDFANASRVSLTLFRDYASHGASGAATAPGPRLFELGLAGTAQVVQRDRRMPAERFEVVDGVAVETADTLVGRIATLLAEPALRDEAARRAQQAVLAAHGFEQRMAEMLEHCRIEAAPGAGVDTAAATATLPGRPKPSPGKLRVLMCTHSTVHNPVWGGVEVYQQMLSRLLEREVDSLFWIRRDGACQLLDAQGRTLERFDAPDIGWLDVLCDPFEEAHFSNVLAAYAIDVVHFQHLGHHAASLPLIARASGVGTLLSVHDFFLVCARYNLLDHEQKFCDIGTRPIAACTICLGAAEGLPAGVQQQRRGFMEQMLGGIDLLLFGSRQSEELVLRIYPQAKAMRRLVMGIPAPSPAVPRPPRAPDADPAGGTLDVVVVGNFLRTKGADTVLRVIEAARPGLRFHIMGMAEPHYREPLRALGERVVYHGRYAPGELSLLHGQVALHLSIWPETWCISLSEVWQAGVIPIVSDIGALGERVTHAVDGFKVRVGDAAGVLDLLEVLRANPEMRGRIRRAIGPHLWAAPEAYAARLLAEYRALAPQTPLGTGKPLELTIPKLHLLAKRSWKELAAPRHILDAQNESGLRLDLPESIVEWVSVQQCTAYVDAVCGEETDPAASLRPGERRSAAGFIAAERFDVHGWAFQPAASQAGQAFVCLVHCSGRHVVFLEAERIARADVHATHPDAPLRSGYAAGVRLAGKWADGEYGIGIILVINGRAAFQLTQQRVLFGDGKVVEVAAVLVDHPAVLRSFATVFAASSLAERFMATAGLGSPAPPPDVSKTAPKQPPTRAAKAAATRLQKPFADAR